MHVAQLNVARLRAPLADAANRSFVAALEPVNAIADATPGFVWRLVGDGGDATDVRLDNDPLVIVNLSVWESLTALRAFTLTGEHRTVLAQRRAWFDPWDGPHVVLWHVAPGLRPTLTEALERLALLAARGPSPDAFGLNGLGAARMEDR
jgi:heme-degrading monooxygenase HmoA